MSKVGAIKPCPFCGSVNVNVEADPLIVGRVSVFCRSCKAHGPIVRSERYAVPSWNGGVRRVVMDGGERLATADATCVALEGEINHLRRSLNRAYELNDFYRENNLILERGLERQRRTWETTAEHLRETRRKLRETKGRLNIAMGHVKVLTKDNGDLLYELRGAELTSIIPAHYRGDGFVSAARALRSAASQPTKTERTEGGFYWWALAFKYVWRLWSKGQADSDAKKAIDCLKRVIWELDEGEEA